MSAPLWAMLMSVALGNNSGSPAESVSNTTAYEWAFEHYDQAVRVVLPIPISATQPFPRETEWLVTVRIRPAFQGEHLADVRKLYQGEIVATYVMVDHSLMKQLEERRRQHYDWTLEQMIPTLDIRRGELSISKCPRMVTVARQLPKVLFSAVSKVELFVDATVYDLVIETATSRAVYSLMGPGTAKGTSHSLVTWAERLRGEIESCISPKPH